MLQPETKTSIPFPAKKRAAKSDISSNISTTSDNEYSVSGAAAARNNRGGYLKLRRGRLERNAPAGEVAWNYEDVMRALGPAAFCAFLYLLDRTVEAYTPRSAADIDESDLADVLRVTPRHVRGVVDDMIQAGVVSRDPVYYWRLSVHVERLQSLPARPRVHKPRTKAEAELRAPDSAAAFKQEPVAEEIHFPDPAAAAAPSESPSGEIHFPESETDCRAPETYCPWNWSCPHLSSDLQGDRLLSSIDIQKPTTTAAPAASGNPYLAQISELGRAKASMVHHGSPAGTAAAYLKRFAEPATRIGELLGLDDAAAAAMWAPSVAVNPELTPREFVILARGKLAEWRRVDDRQPGLKIRGTLTGLLIRSMPNAVCGAPYFAARDEARRELANDRRLAAEMLKLAAAPARDRAWALAVLAEPFDEK